MEGTPAKNFFHEKVFGKTVKVTLNDDRVLFGTLHCVDSRKNLVLMDAVEQIPSKYIAPISHNLNLFIRYGIPAEKYLQLPEAAKENPELLAEINRQFVFDKFLAGQIIVPGSVIKKLEIQK